MLLFCSAAFSWGLVSSCLNKSYFYCSLGTKMLLKDLIQSLIFKLQLMATVVMIFAIAPINVEVFFYKSN